MRRKPSELALVVVSVVSTVILAACSSGSPILRYITISPTSANISVGTTQQFTATGSYSNGSSTTNLAVAWSSSNTSVATINSTSGVATAVAGGTTMITATLSGVTSSAATLSVNQLTSIAVTPANSTISIGATQQFTATGTFKNADGTTSTSDITAQVTWTPGSTAIATFSSTTAGLATGVAAGTTSVTAALDGVNGVTNLTVGNGPVSLVISPATATIAINNSTAFTVQEKWSDGSMHAPSGTVAWSSSATSQAGVVPNGAAAALAAGFGAGTPTITATEGTLTGTATLTVAVGSTHFAYISNNGDVPPTLGFYTVTAPTSPYLTPGTPPTVTVPNNSSQQTILNPNGKYLYTIDDVGNLWDWTIGATGVPTFAGQPSQPGSGGQDTDFGVIDPYGRFLYVSDSGNTSPVVPSAIYAYQISQTDGTLTPVTGSPFTTNLNAPYGLVIDHSGQYIYAANNGSNSISAYQIDQTTGALSPLSTGAVTSAGINAPIYTTLDPTGAHLYVANSGDNSVAGFSIGSGGVLTSLGANLAVTGSSFVINVAVSPNGQTLYVLDNGSTGNGQVFAFALTSGVPSTTPITGTPVATNIGPINMVIDPTGALLAVNNVNPQNPPAAGSISLFTIGSGGTLTADTPVSTGINCLQVTFYDAP